MPKKKREDAPDPAKSPETPMEGNPPESEDTSTPDENSEGEGQAPDTTEEPPAGEPEKKESEKSDDPVPMEVSGLKGNPEKEDGVFIPKARYDAALRKMREASEARDMWDARARCKEAYELLK